MSLASAPSHQTPSGNKAHSRRRGPRACQAAPAGTPPASRGSTTAIPAERRRSPGTPFRSECRKEEPRRHISDIASKDVENLQRTDLILNSYQVLVNLLQDLRRLFPGVILSDSFPCILAYLTVIAVQDVEQGLFKALHVSFLVQISVFAMLDHF